jgi:hypothetical protein
MKAISEAQAALPEKHSGQRSVLGPAALVLGGTLSVVWASALGLCTYDLVCWLFA